MVRRCLAADPNPTFYFDVIPYPDFNHKQLPVYFFYNCFTFLFSVPSAIIFNILDSIFILELSGKSIPVVYLTFGWYGSISAKMMATLTGSRSGSTVHKRFSRFMFCSRVYLYRYSYSLILVLWIRILAVTYHRTAIHGIMYVPIPPFNKFSTQVPVPILKHSKIIQDV